MSPDLINGVFEVVGALFTWMSIRRVFADHGYAGIYYPAVVFFTLWGIWNMFYYPHLGQWWSFSGGSFMVLTNVVWISSMWYFGRKV